MEPTSWQSMCEEPSPEITEELDKLYLKFRLGGPLSNEELVYFHNSLMPAQEVLDDMGPTFRLAWQEMNRITSNLRDYARARGIENLLWQSKK